MSLATLIPAYRMRFFFRALNSVIRQSVRPNFVFISDDSPNGEITDQIRSQKLIEKFKSLNISLVVVNGPKTGSAYHNVKNLADEWNQHTKYFHYLLDDDLIFPNFYHEHLSTLINNDISCTVSRRWRADSNGNLIGCTPIPDVFEKLNLRKLRLDCSELFKSVVPTCQNWLGELTNAVFEQQQMRVLQDYSLENISNYGLGDIGVFLNIAISGKLALINDHLSFFRHHENQNTSILDSNDALAGHLAWVSLAIASRNLGLISDKDKIGVIDKKLLDVHKKYLTNKALKKRAAYFDFCISDYVRTGHFDEQLFLDGWKTFVSETLE
jgi:hypothetical protein